MNYNLAKEKLNVDYFYKTIVNTILTWEDIGLKNIISLGEDTLIRNGLAELNKLMNIKEEELESKFIEVIKNNIGARKSVIGLLALNSYGGSYIKGFKKFIDLNKDEIFFKKYLDENDIEEFKYIFNTSGLKDIIINKDIKDLTSYYIGVCYGITGSNRRKNSTGIAMERTCEKVVSEFCSTNNYQYIKQATELKILEEFNIKIDCFGKRFDFVIYDGSKVHCIEVNYYSTNGSKLKACCQEYINSSKKIKKQGHNFIWITDGAGWNGSRNSLTDAFSVVENIINFNMIKEGALEYIIKK